jgi:DNA-binding FadR family transcriptional regulator
VTTHRGAKPGIAPQGAVADDAVAELLRGARSGRGPSTRSASIAEQIEELILRGDLPRGQRLPTEGELGEMLGVSRSVVRDAVRMLFARGLLDVRQGQGTMVTLPSDDAFSNALLSLLMRSGHTMGDIIEARQALEVQLAPLIAEHVTDEDLSRMEDALERMTAAVEAGDDDAVDEAHLDFHRTMYDALRLPALEAVLRPMQRCILLTSPVLPAEDREAWLESHRKILAALRGRKPAKVQQAVRDHFSDLASPRYDEWRDRPFREVAVLDGERLRAAAERDSAT